MIKSIGTALTVAASALALEGLFFPPAYAQAAAPPFAKVAPDRFTLEQRRADLLRQAIPLGERFYKEVVTLAPRAMHDEKARDEIIIHSQYDLGKTFYLMSEALRSSGRGKEADLWQSRAKEVSDIWAKVYLRTALSEDGYGKLPEQFFVLDSRWAVFKSSIDRGQPDIGAAVDVIQGARWGAFGHPATNPEWVRTVEPNNSTHRAIAHALAARLYMQDVIRAHPNFLPAAVAQALPGISKLDALPAQERVDGSKWMVQLYEIGLERLGNFSPDKQTQTTTPKELILPYMVGRLGEAVLLAHDRIDVGTQNRELAARVAAARKKTVGVVSKAVEKLEVFWDKNAQGYLYANLKYDNGEMVPAPALNGFIAVPAAHLFQLTKDQKFKQLALRNIDGCLRDDEARNPNRGKVFNEVYGCAFETLQRLIE